MIRRPGRTIEPGPVRGNLSRSPGNELGPGTGLCFEVAMR